MSKATQSVVVKEIIEDNSVKRQDDPSYVKRYKRGEYLGKGGFAKCYEVLVLLYPQSTNRFLVYVYGLTSPLCWKMYFKRVFSEAEFQEKTVERDQNS